MVDPALSSPYSTALWKALSPCTAIPLCLDPPFSHAFSLKIVIIIIYCPGLTGVLTGSTFSHFPPRSCSFFKAVRMPLYRPFRSKLYQAEAIHWYLELTCQFYTLPPAHLWSTESVGDTQNIHAQLLCPHICIDTPLVNVWLEQGLKKKSTQRRYFDTIWKRWTVKFAGSRDHNSEAERELLYPKIWKGLQQQDEVLY